MILDIRCSNHHRVGSIQHPSNIFPPRWVDSPRGGVAKRAEDAGAFPRGLGADRRGWTRRDHRQAPPDQPHVPRQPVQRANGSVSTTSTSTSCASSGRPTARRWAAASPKSPCEPATTQHCREALQRPSDRDRPSPGERIACLLTSLSPDATGPAASVGAHAERSR